MEPSVAIGINYLQGVLFSYSFWEGGGVGADHLEYSIEKPERGTP